MSQSRLSVLALVALLSACGGGGGGGGGAQQSPGSDDPRSGFSSGGGSGDHDPFAGGFSALNSSPTISRELTSCQTELGIPSGSTISGSVSFARVGLSVRGLDYAATVSLPARGVVVEAVAADGVRCGSQVLATALTDGNGEYGLEVAADRAVCVQVRAQMHRPAGFGASWDFQVSDNSRDNAPYYLIESSPATAAADPDRHLFAGSGWSGAGYGRPRSAAAFAILDTACESLHKILQVDASVRMPTLNLRWSVNNTEADGERSEGDIGGAFYNRIIRSDSAGNVLAEASEIFLLGDENWNTDEYDPHVISHELAHFYAAQLSRSDSFGGGHRLGDLLDMTVAFDEGWGDAFSGLVLADIPLSQIASSEHYQDTRGADQAGGFSFSLADPDANLIGASPGWYNEASVFRFVYNSFDVDNSGADSLSLGFGALYRAMLDQADKESAISLFSFINSLKRQNSSVANEIDLLAAVENIQPVLDDFGSAETLADNGRFVSAAGDILPVYTPLQAGVGVTLCSNNQFGLFNKLSVQQSAVWQAAAGEHRFRLRALDGGKPALEVYRRGVLVAGDYSDSAGAELRFDADLSTGLHLIRLYDMDNIDTEVGAIGARRCFELSVSP